MGTDKKKLIEAVAALAYSIAKADGTIHHSEKRLFKNIIRREFKEDAWIAESRFDILDSAIAPSIDTAYQNAIDAIKANLGIFDKEMSDTILNVVESVAEAFEGTEDMESELINKMKADFDKLLQKN